MGSIPSPLDARGVYGNKPIPDTPQIRTRTIVRIISPQGETFCYLEPTLNYEGKITVINMSLFQVDPDNPFDGPHQKLSPKTYGAQLNRARAAMILVHGRGATAESMFPLADEFAQPDVHYVAPQAANHTWYPYSFLASTDQNEPGISSGLQMLHDVLSGLMEEGMDSERIMLLGFSQGACLTTEFTARHPRKLGGVVAFSGGLIGPEVNPDRYGGSVERTPVFLGCSNIDPHIPKERVDETEGVFKKLDGDVTKRIYKGMGHTVNEDEIKFVRGMMANMLNS